MKKVIADLVRQQPGEISLLDHWDVEWEHIRQTRYWMHQRFEYRYPGRVRELRQRLVVMPSARYGDQSLRAFNLHVSAPEAQTYSSLDEFGNRVLQIYIPQVDSAVTFDMQLVVERDLETSQVPRLTERDAGRYRAPTPLTTADRRILSVARSLAAQHADQEQLADAVNTWVYNAMTYAGGVTNVDTSAAEALALGRGLCQDYSHIMLAICRAAGLSARYVSGHMLGEGGSHAWVEALLPDYSGGYRVVAFDPTNHRRTTPAYITIAVGRDYRDVTPTSGSYIAPYQGQLISSKRAGLTHLEYRQLPA